LEALGKVIGKEETELADKMISERVQDPFENLDKKDIKLLLPALKIIMSSKLQGLDRYLEKQDGQDDISYNDWIYNLFEKYRNIRSPNNNKLYQSAQNALNKK
jgi:hypothetical protein